MEDSQPTSYQDRVVEWNESISKWQFVTMEIFTDVIWAYAIGEILIYIVSGRTLVACFSSWQHAGSLLPTHVPRPTRIDAPVWIVLPYPRPASHSAVVNCGIGKLCGLLSVQCRLDYANSLYAKIYKSFQHIFEVALTVSEI